jgi:hypothetical protein
MMKRILIGLTTGLLASALFSVVVWAQATAQISGTARDQSGAVLPGVEISATQTDTGISRSTVTNETGSYVLANLAIGPYRLEAGLPGFRTFVQSGVVLQVNSNPVINPVLEVGAVTEQVEVKASAALVETRSSGVGQVIENARILELPLNGRNVTELITLAGAAVSAGGEGISGRDFNGSPRLNIGGGMIYAVGFTLDGADYSNTMSISGLPMPFPDALQEFKVETSGVTVQDAKSSGVSAVTKSGTNEFHGDLFEFLRNDLFNAQRYFAPKKSTLKRNQFGGTIGGPIMKNRLFFFAGYQGTTVRQDFAAESFLPTARMLSGDWTAFASPACNAGRPLSLRAPFSNNQINPALYSPAAVNIMRRVNAQAPVPENECGQVRYSRPSKQNHYQTIGRLDYQWNNKHSVFGRYTAYQFNEALPFGLTPNNVLNAATEGNDNLMQSFAFGDMYLIGSRTVNAFRLSANRLFDRQLGSNDSAARFWSSCDVGIRMYCDDTPGRSYLNITSGFLLGTLHDSTDAVWSNAFQINDDVSHVRGNHQFSFGGSLGLASNATRDRWYGTGQFRIFGQVTGHGLGDFMSGFGNSYADAGPHHFKIRQWTPVLYGTDTWKASRRLTVTYGLRWEPYLPGISARGQVANFSVDRFNQGIRSQAWPKAPAGAYYPGDPGHPGKAGAFNRWGQFAPRLGLAWDVNGDGRTSVRAGYSYASTLVGSHWYETPSMSAPWANNIALSSVSLDDPWRTFPGGNPFPYVQGTFAPYGEFYSTPYDLKTLHGSSWNLSIQRQIGTAWLVSAAYLGSQNNHLWFARALNPAIFFPGVADANGNCAAAGYTLRTAPGSVCSSLQNTDARRRLNLQKPQEVIGNVAHIDDGGTGNYHGLLVTVEHRAARGVTINGNYTLSHCINDGVYESFGGLNNANNVSYNDPNNRRFDRGNCEGDRRQIFNMTAVAETPQFSGRTLRMLATGWKLSGIYRRSSGSVLNILAGSDRALTGIRGAGGEVLQRGVQLSGDPYTTDKSGGPLTNWLNRAAFDLPALGTFGNVGRNSAVGPPTWAFDLALSRGFNLRETQRVEVRAEAFNVTNSFRPGNPAAGLNSAQFGQIRTSYDPRILQFALKYIF